MPTIFILQRPRIIHPSFSKKSVRFVAFRQFEQFLTAIQSQSARKLRQTVGAGVISVPRLELNSLLSSQPMQMSWTAFALLDKSVRSGFIAVQDSMSKICHVMCLKIMT